MELLLAFFPPFNITETELTGIFVDHDSVVSVELIIDYFAGESK
jgi:hypothetical protein